MSDFSYCHYSKILNLNIFYFGALKSIYIEWDSKRLTFEKLDILLQKVQKKSQKFNLNGAIFEKRYLLKLWVIRKKNFSKKKLLQKLKPDLMWKIKFFYKF